MEERAGALRLANGGALMAKTKISWATDSWNPLAGCSRVSPGCDHCYAFQLHDQRHIAWKRERWPKAPAQYHRPFSEVQLLPDRLGDPLHWRKPRRVFVNSMSDLFHEHVPDEFIDRVFAVMALSDRHTYQVLTKRPERMLAYLRDERAWGVQPRIYLAASKLNGDGRKRYVPSVQKLAWPLPNVWLGVSVEDQHWADERIPILLQTPAAVRFISAEPLLGSVDLSRWLGCKDPACDCKPWLDWVIAGGESGPRARPCDPDWLRSLRDQCAANSVAFHLKQLGGRKPGGTALLDSREWREFPDD